jgi:acid phosphatase
VEELGQLSEDASNNQLPGFLFITPNICNSGHDCSLQSSDQWLENTLPPLVDAFKKEGNNYLIIVTWDEGQTKKSCCGLPSEAGGHIVTILISPQAKQAFQDDTPYTTYSLLRTISEAWGLPLLAHAADDDNKLILAPWE